MRLGNRHAVTMAKGTPEAIGCKSLAFHQLESMALSSLGHFSPIKHVSDVISQHCYKCMISNTFRYGTRTRTNTIAAPSQLLSESY